MIDYLDTLYRGIVKWLSYGGQHQVAVIIGVLVGIDWIRLRGMQLFRLVWKKMEEDPNNEEEARDRMSTKDGPWEPKKK